MFLFQYQGTMQQPEDKKFSNRKYVIAAVAAVVVIGMIIGGVLAGIYLQNKHTDSVVRHVKVGKYFT